MPRGIPLVSRDTRIKAAVAIQVFVGLAFVACAIAVTVLQYVRGNIQVELAESLAPWIVEREMRKLAKQLRDE